MREILVYAALCPLGEEHRAAWELLALALERELGIPALPETERGEGGKPFFPRRPDVRFNLSHSRGAVACAVHDEEIGVDIERLRTPPKRLGRGMAPEDFFRLWTAREATVKRRGQGVAALLQGEAPDPRCRCLTGLLPGWVITVCPSVDAPVRAIRVEKAGEERHGKKTTPV